MFHAKENVAGAYIGQVLPQNGTGATAAGTRFFIVNQQDVPDISITEDGALYAPKGLDREARQNYSITVIAESPRGVGVFQVSILLPINHQNWSNDQFRILEFQNVFRFSVNFSISEFRIFHGNFT